MREHLFATVDLSQQAGRPLSCTYHILIKDITEPIQCESYGVRVTVNQTGERKELPDITVLPDAVLKAGTAASRRWRNSMYSAFHRRGLADLTGTRQAHDT